MTRRIIRSLAALAALTALAAAAYTGTASAAVKSPGGTLSSGGAVVTTTAAPKIKTGATGDGPADESTCQTWGTILNAIEGAKFEASNDGRMTDAYYYDKELDSFEDLAMDSGCFVID